MPTHDIHFLRSFELPMFDKIKRIWKDPVLSKVIAVGVVALITLVYNLITATVGKTTFKNEFIAFWTSQIELWVILLFAALALTLYLVVKNIEKFTYDSETLKLDRDFFNQIRETHLTEDMMLAPKNFSFSSDSFLGSSLIDLFKISEESKKSNFEFINPTLEKRKQKLINELDNLYQITSSYIFGTGNSGYLSIPSEWKCKDPERMQEAIANISRQEKLLSDTYDDLIKTGRRILKI